VRFNQESTDRQYNLVNKALSLGWKQDQTHHPHAHMIVPAGGLSPDGQHWIACRPGFFLAVRVLSRLFRIRLSAIASS
jgi:hypothetical protein